MPRETLISLAAYAHIGMWKPEIGDFVFYYGFFSRWVGVITKVEKGMLTIVYEGIPLLLLTIDEESRVKKTIRISKSRMINSSPGKYNVIQNNCWYVHA